MKRGPKPIEIDQKLFEELCVLHCTQEEIARCFECSVDTIARWVEKTYGVKFAEIYAIKSQIGKLSLRRTQYSVAKRGNPSMLIWLDKQWLGGRENREEHSHKLTDETINEFAEYLLWKRSQNR